jgi:hypothetical protein
MFLFLVVRLNWRSYIINLTRHCLSCHCYKTQYLMNYYKETEGREKRTWRNPRGKRNGPQPVTVPSRYNSFHFGFIRFLKLHLNFFIPTLFGATYNIYIYLYKKQASKRTKMKNLLLLLLLFFLLFFFIID